MSKAKKKGSKKSKPSKDLLDTASRTLKKFQRVSKLVGKLTTTQKVVGGLALAAAGLAYLASQAGGQDAASSPQLPAEAAGEDFPSHQKQKASPSARLSAKPKSRKSASIPKHPPFSEEVS